jgi:hypothetical protein
MANYQYRIELNEPCHENWNRMTPNEKGRFCQSCSKTVIDFSQQTDTEIIRFIEANQGQLCGRFQPSQLNRMLVLQQNYTGNKSHFAYKLLTSLLLLNGIAANTATAQQVVPIVQAFDRSETPSPEDSCEAMVVKEKSAIVREILQKDSLPIEIKGKVLDERGQPVSYASIVIKGTNIGTPADVNGNFELKIPAKMLRKKVTLVCSSVGFEKLEKTIKIKDSANIQFDVRFELKMRFAVSGGFAVVKYKL